MLFVVAPHAQGGNIAKIALWSSSQKSNAYFEVNELKDSAWWRSVAPVLWPQPCGHDIVSPTLSIVASCSCARGRWWFQTGEGVYALSCRYRGMALPVAMLTPVSARVTRGADTTHPFASRGSVSSITRRWTSRPPLPVAPGASHTESRTNLSLAVRRRSSTTRGERLP